MHCFLRPEFALEEVLLPIKGLRQKNLFLLQKINRIKNGIVFKNNFVLYILTIKSKKNEFKTTTFELILINKNPFLNTSKFFTRQLTSSFDFCDSKSFIMLGKVTTYLRFRNYCNYTCQKTLGGGSPPPPGPSPL